VIIDNSNKDEAIKFFPLVQSEIMKGVKKGIMKLNTASRKVGNISKKIKNI
jgi:ribosomal protein S20